MKKIIVALSILCLQACATNERTKIIESNIKDMQVYAENGELICKELPCPVKFDEKTGQSQKVKLKVDGFEGDSDIDIKIWQGERNIRRAGSISNVVLYPISTIAYVPKGILSGLEKAYDEAPVLGIRVLTFAPLTTTIAIADSASKKMRMVNDIWFYDPDHIYINVKLCDKNNQCVYPYELGYKGYGYVTGNRGNLIQKESWTSAKLIKKDEISTKRFVLHNYAELKSGNTEYIRTLNGLTDLSDDKLRDIIGKSKSAPELAETLARYSSKKK